MIPQLRARFNEQFRPDAHHRLLACVEERCRAPVEFRVAQTPVFVPLAMLEQMAATGVEMAEALVDNAAYLAAARQAIPAEWRAAGGTSHPNFLAVAFGLIRNEQGCLVPQFLEIRAFPSLCGFQPVLCASYRAIYGLGAGLGSYLSGLDDGKYWTVLTRTVLGSHDPENVVLAAPDPAHHILRPDFKVTGQRLGIPVVDIGSLEVIGNRLQYRGVAGRPITVHRIYDRARPGDPSSRPARLPKGVTCRSDVEWASHPDWSFLIGNFSLPWLWRSQRLRRKVPPAVSLDEFLAGSGREELEGAGVRLPAGPRRPETIYRELVLKPAFSFAGEEIQIEPAQEMLEAIPKERRAHFLLQQRIHLEPAIETPQGLLDVKLHILYLWPDDATMVPALAMAQLGSETAAAEGGCSEAWTGVSAAFYPCKPAS